MVLTNVIKQIDIADLKEYADSGLDKIEVKYKDNKLVMAGCVLIREVCSIEDGDD